MSSHNRGIHEMTGLVGKGALDTEQQLRSSNPRMADALINYAFGTVLCQSEITRHDRELVTLAILAAIGGTEPQIRVHLRGAIRSGVTPEELLTLSEHLAVYVGIPRALNYHSEAVRFLKEELSYQTPPTRTVKLKDHETFLTDTGGPERPLILIHAIGLDRRMWNDAIPFLSKNRRILAYDFRGHGKASINEQPFTLKTLADDLKLLMDSESISKADIVGLSIGGGIAQQFALTYPERVNSLTLVCTTATSHPAFSDRASKAEQEGMGAQIIPTLLRWFTPAALAENPWHVRYAREQLVRTSLNDWINSWRALAGIDTFLRLNELQMPVHLIAGELDPSTTPAEMKKMGEQIRGSTFQVVPGGPHMLSLEKPRDLAEAILKNLHS